MILQSPKILRAIRNEQKQIAELQQSHQFDLIISDNRFGVYHRDCKNVFISHQLNLQVNGYWKYAKPFIDAQHQSFWSHYQELWIPDEPGDESLSGDLSNASFPGDIKERFIGTLSRLKKKPAPEKKYETLSIISGPEPQRSHLEEKICLELKSVPGKHLVIRGVESERMENGNITKLGLQNGEEISKRIAESKIVISRSGYTSLMDYIHLGVRAIIIPTPGQTEQEYLAKRMKEKEWFYAVDQDQLDLVTALSEVKKYEPPTRRNHLLEKELKESLSFSLPHTNAPSPLY